MADWLVSLRLIKSARLLSVAAYVLLVFIPLVLLAAEFSGRQPATVALDVGFSFVRAILPLYVILLAQELLGREIERRYFLVSFTYPRSRAAWLVGRICALVFVLYAVLVVMAVLQALVVTYVETTYKQGTPVALGLHYWITVGFIGLDLFVILSFVVLLTVAARTPGFVMVGAIGFVLISRSYGAIIELLRQGENAFVAKLADQEHYTRSLSFLNFIMPDLGALDVRSISLYGNMDFLPADWVMRSAAAMTYGFVLLLVSAWVLRRREFS